MGNVPTKREQCQTCLGNAERAEQVTKAKPKGNVPNLRFPEFSGEWKKCTIDDLCEEFKSGKNIKADNILNEGEYPVFGGNGLRGYTDCYNHEGDYVLIGRQGALCGNIRFVTGKTYITEHAIAAKATNNNNTRFLESLFIQLNLGKFSDQSAQPGLAVNKLLKIETSVPSKDEQEKIASLLQNIDKRIATQNKIIEDLKKLKSAIRKQVFVSLKEDNTESCEINQLLTYEQPTVYIVTNDEYSTDTTLIPVLTANKGFVLGYTDEDFGIYQKGECIIFDDFTMDAKYVSFPFKVKSSAIKILTAKPNVNLRFIFEYLSYLELKSEEHKRHYISEIASLVIEVPLLKRQNEIAFLMTSLENKLTLEENVKVRYEDEKQYLLSQMFI